MRFNELFRTEIMEGRDAFLYHATSPYHASIILRENCILDKTKQNVNGYGQPVVTGVSLSRSPMTTQFGDVIFQLDQSRLAQNNRLVPFNYWAREHGKTRPQNDTESEEFCIGKIEPLTRYLVTIFVSPEVADHGFHGNQHPKILQHQEICKTIMQHPKVKMFSKDSRAKFYQSFR